MWRHWWNLPGPRTFVERVVADLRQGKNVLIGLPKYFPPQLGDAVREVLDHDGMFRWRTHHDVGDHEPVEFLSSRYATDLELSELFDPGDLANSDDFVGHVIWIDELTQGSSEKWKIFATEYSRRVRNRLDTERGLVCIVVCGEPRQHFPPSDIALSVHFLQDTWSEMDLMGWLYQHVQTNAHVSALELRLRMALGVELLRFDPLMANDVAGLPLATLVEPREWLKSVASDRGWLEGEAPDWHAGTCAYIAGKRVDHSALLALDDRASALLASCVWRAQLAVLFPLIEEVRIRILEEYRDRLLVPYEAQWGIVERIEDLEIGHVLHQLGNRIGPKEQRQLRLLKNARNKLAHHSPLPIEELQLLIEEHWVY